MQDNTSHDGTDVLDRAARRRVARGESPWVPLSGAADYLGVDVRTIRNMIADGRLLGYRSGRNMIRLRRADLDAALVPFGGAAL